MTPTRKTLFLFDVDGTLCESQQAVTDSTLEWLLNLSQLVDVGLVSGSDKAKVLKQFKVEKPEDLLVRAGVRFVLFENAVQSILIRDDSTGVVIHQGNVIENLGEDLYQEIVNFCLNELSQIKLPVKRDLMIETRSGNINVCPVGRRCSQAERVQFAEFDAKHNIRTCLADKIRTKYGHRLHVGLGGQISLDLAPLEWTKALALEILAPKYYSAEQIYFFGDHCGEEGNDEPLYRAVSHGFWVSDVSDCQKQANECLAKLMDDV